MLTIELKHQSLSNPHSAQASPQSLFDVNPPSICLPLQLSPPVASMALPPLTRVRFLDDAGASHARQLMLTTCLSSQNGCDDGWK